MYNQNAMKMPDPIEVAEVIEKIADMLTWNSRQINDIEQSLNDKNPNTYCNLFNKHREYREKLKFKLQVRKRLIAKWNNIVKIQID